MTMPEPTLTDLIVFNPTLKHADTDSSGRLSRVDKEDYDEVSQVLFADGTGLRNSRGETEWNAVLRQMGLAKGLMGFTNMIEDQSFPEPEENSFQIIHSKKRVTCIYQIEQDHTLIAVFAVPPPPTPAVTSKSSSSTKHAKLPPAPTARPVLITDEQYEYSLARACGRYLVEYGSPSNTLKMQGREAVESALQTFFGGWMEGARPTRESLTRPVSNFERETAGLDKEPTTSIAWEALVKEMKGQGADVQSILISPDGILMQSGSDGGRGILDDSALQDHLRWKLEQSLPLETGSSPLDGSQSGNNASGEASHQRRSESGTWKKLGISSWAPSLTLGLGSSEPSKGKETASASNSSSNPGTGASTGKWGGIGQWFGMTSDANSDSPSSSSSRRLPEAAGVVDHTESGQKGVNQDQVDLASLHSALESEAGEREAKEGLEWTVEEVWVQKGMTKATLAFVVKDGKVLAIAMQGHDASLFQILTSTLNQPILAPLFTRREKTSRSLQFPAGNENEDEHEEDEISYHNPLGLEVRQTRTAGRGVFAPGDIPAGTILEESPVLILTQHEWEQGKLNDGVLGGYAFNWSNGGMAVGLGIASMFNHSPNPNVNFIRRAPTSKSPDVSPAMVFMTCRPIRKGEELFICYGQESKLWFSPNYGGKAAAETTRDYEEEVAEAADAFLSGFEGLAENTEEEVEHDTTIASPDVQLVDPPEAVIKTSLPNRTETEAIPENLFSELNVGEDNQKDEDEEKRARRREKKALQDEKTAKYQHKKAIRKADKSATISAQTEVQLAPPVMIDTSFQLEEPSYQAALQALDLAPAIKVSPEDVDTIKAEEVGQDEFEGEFGFAGWRSVKRVPGLSEGGEPSLDSTLEIWAADLPPQLIGKLSQYVRKRQLVEDELSHLRRIYKNLSAGTTLIALYLTSKKSRSEVQADLADYDSELSDLKLVQKTVPARAAHSMKEVEHLRSLWPVALRQRPIVASDLPWSADRKAWVKNGMQIVIDLAKRNKAQGELPVAVYAASPPLEAQLNEPDAIPPTPDIRASGVDTRKAARHPLRHATISCVTEIAKLRTVSPFADIQATRNGAGYLLTSLSVFMSHEPCVMCVMALVHSRVKEVFYLSSAGGVSNGGGFGGSYPVHSHSGLNHQMDLFDCSSLVSQADIDDIKVADIVDL